MDNDASRSINSLAWSGLEGMNMLRASYSLLASAWEIRVTRYTPSTKTMFTGGVFTSARFLEKRLMQEQN